MLGISRPKRRLGARLLIFRGSANIRRNRTIMARLINFVHQSAGSLSVPVMREVLSCCR
jgi:hypothetical protein